MKNRIPIRIDPIVDSNNGSSIEIFMDLESFEGYGTTIRKDIQKFRQDYLNMINTTKKLDVERGNISTTKRWKVCKMLADFNRIASNRFEIINLKQAYARDFKLPMRNIRTYLDFGEHFSEDEIRDGIPYSTYAELCFKLNSLKITNKFDAEKKHLLDMHDKGTLPTRNEYREYLKTAAGKMA